MLEKHVQEQAVVDFVRKVLEPVMMKLQQQFQPGTAIGHSLTNTGAYFRKTYQLNVDGMGVDITISTHSMGLNFIVNRTGSSYIPRGCNFIFGFNELATITVSVCKGSIEEAILTVVEVTR